MKKASSTPASTPVKKVAPPPVATPEEPVNNTPIHLSFLLDESGSMEDIRDDTIGGFNCFINKQKEVAGEMIVTLVKFDSQNPQNIVFKGLPIHHVPALTHDSFTPRGGTPLVDAAYRMIKETEDSISGKRVNVIIVIQTDGLENSSVHHVTSELKALIETKQGQGWVFTFLGAGIDAYSIASNIGIRRDMTSSYGLCASGAGFDNLSNHIASYRSTGSARSMCYTQEELKAQGDEFTNKVK